MFLKKTILFIIVLSTLAFAHKVAGVDMEVQKVGDDKILINAFFTKSKRTIAGNEVRLISMFDNRVLDKGKLSLEGLVLNIPSESYWVYVIVRDNDIVKDGLAPTKGFDKMVKLDKVAFLYTSLATILFLLLAFFIGFKRVKSFKTSLN